MLQQVKSQIYTKGHFCTNILLLKVHFCMRVKKIKNKNTNQGEGLGVTIIVKINKKRTKDKG